MLCSLDSWSVTLGNVSYITNILNPNQSRFPLDFPLTFTIILPSVTRTVNNSKIPLTRSKICFPSAHFYTVNFTLDNSNHAISAWQVRRKKPCTEVRDIRFISKQPSKFFVFTFLSLEFKFSVHSCIHCSLTAVASHRFAYFLTSGYLHRTPDNSNFFLDFPWRKDSPL